MTGPHRTRRALVGLPLLFIAALASTACDDDLFTVRWELSPDTTSLYSLARPELNLPSAFNLNQRLLVQVEAPQATGSWDFAIDTQDGELVFVTPRMLGITSESGITAIEESFDGVTQAPADTARYVNTEPIPIEVGQVYVVRTFEATGRFGQSCNYYGKVEPISLDPAIGTVEFRYDSSPVCNDRSLVPPN